MASTRALDGLTIVFDLDGTLVDTAPDLIGALNHTLTTSGLRTVPDMAVSELIGSGAKAMIKAGLAHQNAELPDDQIDDMFTTFLDFYIENIAIDSRPYEGCEAALSKLTSAGATLAVCTNKRQNLADTLLLKLGLADRFEAIVGADSVPNRKPDPGHIREAIRRAGRSQSDAIMVGDSLTDERAAHGAGLPFILCPFGYGPVDETPPGHRFVLKRYADLTGEMALQITEAYAATVSRDTSDV